MYANLIETVSMLMQKRQRRRQRIPPYTHCTGFLLQPPWSVRRSSKHNFARNDGQRGPTHYWHESENQLAIYRLRFQFQVYECIIAFDSGSKIIECIKEELCMQMRIKISRFLIMSLLFFMISMKRSDEDSN